MDLRPVALLTDFGLHDPFVGICHAVILSEDPSIPIIDLTHGIARQDVRAGSVALADAVAYLPERTVVAAVVDPGVGSDRRAIAVEAENGLVFVGPDNGLLSPALEASGGAKAAFDVGNSEWRIKPVSNTFHGRDVFSPVAAKVAAGAPLVESGVAIDHDDLAKLDHPETAMVDGALTTAVLAVDGYGNARLAATTDDLAGLEPGGAVEIKADGAVHRAEYVNTYSDVAAGELVLLVDSSRSLSLAVSGGHAAGELGLEPGMIVQVTGA